MPNKQDVLVFLILGVYSLTGALVCVKATQAQTQAPQYAAADPARIMPDQVVWTPEPPPLPVEELVATQPTTQPAVEEMTYIQPPAPQVQATVAPAIHGILLTPSEVESLAFTVSGDSYFARAAVAIWTCESGLNTGAISPGGDYGIPQINRGAHGGRYDFNRILTDPLYATQAGYEIYLSQGFGAWYHCAKKAGYL